MQISNITTPHIELTEDLADYLQKRLDSCDKFLPEQGAMTCDVELARTTEHHQQGDVYYAEVNLSIDGTLHRATATAESMHAAIDEVKDELQRELRRKKEKDATRFRKGARKVKNMMRGWFGGK